MRILAILSVVILLSTSHLRAHDYCAAPTTGSSNQGFGLVLTGGYLNHFSPIPITHQFLIGVFYRGYTREQNAQQHHHHDSTSHTNHPRRFVQYFQVMVHGAFHPTTSSHAINAIDSVSIAIIPRTDLTTYQDLRATGFRWFPLQIQPRSPHGFNSNYVVNALGFSYQFQAPLNSTEHNVEEARLRSFGQMAVNLIGLRYSNYALNQHFLGGQLGTLQVLGGLSWNPHRAMALRLGLGAAANIAMGGNAGNGHFIAMGETEFFGRLEIAFNALALRTSVYADWGVHNYHNIDFANIPSSTVHLPPPTGGHAHGATEPDIFGLNTSHGFLFIGANVGF